MTRTALHARCATIVPSATMHVQNYAGSGINSTVDDSALQADTRSVCVIHTAVGCVAQLVECRFLTGKLSLSHARPVADG